MTKINLTISNLHIVQLHQLIDHHRSDLAGLTAGSARLQQTLLAAMQFLVAWDLPVNPDLSPGQAIFAFAFGQGPNQTPGSVNFALAAAIEQLLTEHDLPIFAQWEIAAALHELGVKVDFKAVPQGKYLNTQDVLDQFRAEWQRRGLSISGAYVILVTHPDHRLRCQKVTEATGLATLIPDDQDFLAQAWSKFGCDADGYDPNSAQVWTRSREVYIAHELAMRLAWLREQVVETSSNL